MSRTILWILSCLMTFMSVSTFSLSATTVHRSRVSPPPMGMHISPTASKRRLVSQTRIYSTDVADSDGSNSKMEAILSTLTSGFPFWVLLAGVWGVAKPSHLAWVNSGQSVELMLASVMIGMGMTLERKDFTAVLSEDWSAVPFGVICQFGIMPVAAWFVGRTFLLPIDPSLYLGLALVGCSPGGTASNLVALIAGANVALSVLLTAASTFLAAAMTPLLVKLLVGGTEIAVSGKALFLATAKVVLGPVLIGMLLNAKLPKLSKSVSRFTPFSSVLLVALICGGVVAKNAASVLSASNLVPRILAAVAVLHTVGFTTGYCIPKFLGRYRESTARTISIETGMQNSALAVVLAQSIGAPPLAALPGAISAITHSCLGSIMAAYWRITDNRQESGEEGNVPNES